MFRLKYKYCVPVKKWFIVNGFTPLMSSFKGKWWRLLKVNSRATKNVLSGSSCTEQSLSTNFSDCFIVETIDFQELTIHELDGGLNFDLTPF